MSQEMLAGNVGYSNKIGDQCIERVDSRGHVSVLEKKRGGMTIRLEAVSTAAEILPNNVGADVRSDKKRRRCLGDYRDVENMCAVRHDIKRCWKVYMGQYSLTDKHYDVTRLYLRYFGVNFRAHRFYLNRYMT